MIIEQPEAFKTWLTAVLRPMCDADPAALAKYVLALIKKDKSEEELQKIMVGQLEVFLENETESFVNLVLRTLETQDYITTPVIPNTNPPNPNMVKPTTTTTVTAKETKTIVQPSELPNLNETINGSSVATTTTTTTTTATTTTTTGTTRKEHESKRERDLRKSDFEKDDRPSRIRSRHRSSSRNRSRSRSWDRSRRSKSRDRDLYRDKRSRLSNRNKSPPNRRYRRSRTPHTSPILQTTTSIIRRSSRSRSPKYRSRYRNRTPPPIRDRSLTRSRSRSLPPPPPSSTLQSSLLLRERRDSNKESRNRPDTPTQDSNHGDTDFRLTNTTQSIQSVIVQQSQPIQQTMTTKRRCRDFDEKGYCMRGEMCPFDHGIDPVVLEDAALSTVLTTYNPNNTNTGGNNTNNNGNNGNTNGTNDLTTQLTSGHPSIISGVNNNGPRIIPTEYNPQAPQIWNRPGFRGPRPINNMPRGPIMGGFPSQPNLQRELIPVPVMDNKPESFNNNSNNNGPNYRHQPFNNNNNSNSNNNINSNNMNMVNENDQIGYNHNNNNMNHGNMMGKKKSFDFNRLGPRSINHHHHNQHHHHHHGHNNNNNSNNNNNNNKMNYPTNSSLELRKIPQGLNTIAHLNNHFSKFGKPINIQVNYDNDPEAAIITFSSHAEANAAYRSTEAVLNNRFIKVFWHNNNNNNSNTNNNNNDGKQENIPPRSVKERLGIPAIVPPNTNKVLNLVQSRNNDTIKTNDENIENNNNNEITSDKLKTITNNNSNNNKDDKAQQAAAIKKNQELLAVKEKLKKNQDEQRKEVLKMKNSLRKRKQELLEKQLSQQKVLIEKMEKLPAGPQRDHIMETIKKTQESIEETKKDLLQSVLITKTTQQQQQQQQPAMMVIIKKKEDVQREMLDAELDLITKQQEGADTTEIQKRLIELRAKVALTTTTSLTTLSTTPSMIRGRSNSSGNRISINRRFNPILNRHLLTKNNLIDNGVKSNIKSVNKAFQKHTVDHRPTRLLISGYEADEQDSVLSHFQSFGEIVDYSVDATLPSITLNYKTRKEAEMALLKGKHFQDRTLSITWSTTLHPQTTPTTNNSTTITTNPTTTTDEIQLQQQQQQQEQQQEKPEQEQQENLTMKRTNSNKTLLNETTDEDQLIEQHLQGGEGEEDLIGPEISEEALLQDDEEEEEENEDRSWRR